MANDYRDDDRESRNRGMFGYEGEGYMSGGWSGGSRARDDRGGGFRLNDYGDFNRGDYSRGDRGGYGYASASDYGTRPSHRGKGPKNYQRSDDRIREDVCERLFVDDDVDASDIEVAVNGATVTLSGTVHDRFEKRRAEDIAESVLGVRDVQNQIRVARG